MMNISICIATYRRCESLNALLGDLAQQQRKPDEVIVVDNDACGSARSVVERWRNSALPFPIRYDIQPLKNISLTRNRTVELASGDWIAFIDDDERAPESWLLLLTLAVLRFDADGILGPVEPVVPADAPRWIRRGHFYDWARMSSGATIQRNKLRFGNLLLRGALLRSGTPPFDPAHGLTGGEDGDLLARLAQQGARFIWCDEALVREPVASDRLSLHWLLRRAMRGGQDFARHNFSGHYGQPTQLRRVRLFMRSLLQLTIAVVLAALIWPAGRHHAARWLIKAAANIGKLSAFWGWHYREYAGVPTS